MTEERNIAFDNLQLNSKTFQVAEKLTPEADSQRKHAEKFGDYEEQKWSEEISEIKWKNKARKYYGTVFTLLLFLQNISAFYLIYKSYCQNRIQELRYILPVIIPATLIETAYIIKIMMQWIFSNIDYFNHKKSDSSK